MSNDYLNFMNISRGKWPFPFRNSSDESAKFSSLKMEENESSSLSANSSESRSWSKMKLNTAMWEDGNVRSTTDTSSGSQTADKATGMRSFIEKQKCSYIRRLQREIKWLEKVEKLLLDTQNKNKEAKKKKSCPLKYQPLELNLENTNKSDYEKKRIPIQTWIDKESYERSNRRNEVEETNTFSDRYFVSIPTQKKERTKNVPVKPILGKTIRKIDTKTLAKTSSIAPEMFINHRVEPQPKVNTPSVSWFIPLGETKPWLQTRGPGDGSHSNATRPAQPDGDEVTSTQLSLQDAINYFKGNFILRSQARQQKIGIAARDRKLRTQLNFVYLTRQREQRFTNPEPETEGLHRPQRRIFSHRQMREQTERKYRMLPEVLEEKDKRRRLEREKTHRLMAQVYKRKVQEKALQGKLSYTLTERLQNSLWDL